MSKTTVYVVGGDLQVLNMFAARGFEGWPMTSGAIPPDLICFTGGADVSPKYYGEENYASFCDAARDERECRIFETYFDIPKVGICRGGQLLNVLSGGRMIQDIPGHSMNDHDIFDIHMRQMVTVLGDHHQAMVPAEMKGKEPEVIAKARDGIVEVVYYQTTESLCFQAHPEWGHKGTETYFFNLLAKTLGVAA